MSRFRRLRKSESPFTILLRLSLCETPYPSPRAPPPPEGGTPVSASPNRPVRRRAFVLGGAAAVGTAALSGPLASPASAAAFDWSDDGSNYVVDTGANLVFKVDKTNGDLTSLVHRGSAPGTVRPPGSRTRT
ncbi:rhamnogalacturonan lyase B N-terminal domain-containing protein [Streptomyces populi]